MFTRTRLTTLPVMILGGYYTHNVYLQSLYNFRPVKPVAKSLL